MLLQFRCPSCSIMLAALPLLTILVLVPTQARHINQPTNFEFVQEEQRLQKPQRPKCWAVVGCGPHPWDHGRNVKISKTQDEGPAAKTTATEDGGEQRPQRPLARQCLNCPRNRNLLGEKRPPSFPPPFNPPPFNPYGRVVGGGSVEPAARRPWGQQMSTPPPNTQDEADFLSYLTRMRAAPVADAEPAEGDVGKAAARSPRCDIWGCRPPHFPPPTFPDDSGYPGWPGRVAGGGSVKPAARRPWGQQMSTPPPNTQDEADFLSYLTRMKK